MESEDHVEEQQRNLFARLACQLGWFAPVPSRRFETILMRNFGEANNHGQDKTRGSLGFYGLPVAKEFVSKSLCSWPGRR